MKKLIALIVIVVVVLIFLKIIGVDGLVSWRSTTREDEYEQGDTRMSAEDKTVEDVIGTPLPDTATDVHDGYTTYSRKYTNDKVNWVTAKLPKQDFYRLVDGLGLIKKPDLLEFWPDAFECEQNAFYEDISKFWHAENAVNEETYYIREPEEETYMAVKYERGRVYVKKLTSYMSFVGSDGKVRYIKKGRPAAEFIIANRLPDAVTNIYTGSYSNIMRDTGEILEDLAVLGFDGDEGAILEENYFAIFELSKSDFYDFIDEVGLVEKPDLLEIWPRAFDCKEHPFTKQLVQFWDVTKKVNDETYYGEHDREETYWVFKYENEKVYVKRITKHAQVKVGGGRWHWQKARKKQ